MRLIVIFIMVIITDFGYSQDEFFVIDSIKVHYVPWEMRPYLSLGSEDIRLYKGEPFYSETLIEDSTAIRDLQEIDLLATEQNLFSKELDVRMVIDVYCNGKIMREISLNRVLYFDYLDVIYYRNSSLNKWIKDYVLKPDEKLPR